MGFEPTTSAVTGRRSNQLSHQANLILIVPSKLHINYTIHESLVQDLFSLSFP